MFSSVINSFIIIVCFSRVEESLWGAGEKLAKKRENFICLECGCERSRRRRRRKIGLCTHPATFILSWSYELCYWGRNSIQDCLLYDYYSSKHFSIILLGFGSSSSCSPSFRLEGPKHPTRIPSHRFNLLLFQAASHSQHTTRIPNYLLRVNQMRDKINVFGANKFYFRCRCWFVCSCKSQLTERKYLHDDDDETQSNRNWSERSLRLPRVTSREVDLCA